MKIFVPVHFKLLCFGALLLTTVGRAAESDPDLPILKKAKITNKTADLLAYLRKHTPTADALKNVDSLIRDLGADSFATREKAQEKLIALGGLATSALKKATNDSDLERSRRAAECLERIGKDENAPVIRAAVRSLSKSNSTDAIKALLKLVAYSSSESLENDIHKSLIRLSKTKGSETILLRELNASMPLTRATAGVVLATTAEKTQLAEVRKLLTDPKPPVRLRIGLTLALQGEKAAFPVLIDLIGKIPHSQFWKAEELLFRLAGEKSPTPPSEATDELMKKYRLAWGTWWKTTGVNLKTDALKNTRLPLGYTLVVLLSKGAVVELDRDGKKRWEVKGLSSPLDAQVLPGRRVLIAECSSNRVTERTFDGKILWQKKLKHNPIRARRMPDGRTFITTRHQLLIVARDGSEKVLWNTAATIRTGTVFPNGNIGFVCDRVYRLLNPAGKELKQFQAPGVTITSSVEALRGGNVLMLQYNKGLVTEREPSGKVIWSINEARPISGVKLPNGHVLVTSQDNYIAEYDRSRRLVKKFKIDGHPTQVRRR